MKRIHLFEFMDLNWYPKVLRNIQTNILQVIMKTTKAFDHTIPYIQSIIESTGNKTIIDLCSGASGPWERIYKKLPDEHINILLSDKYPNINIFQAIKKRSDNRIGYIGESIDVLSTEYSKDITYTIFTGFHHFRPNEIKMFLGDIQKNESSICIFDYVPNKLLIILLTPITIIISFLQFYILSFLVRPYTVQQLLFTNIIPIVPIVSAWDGFVSGLRKYSKKELIKIIGTLKSKNYNWIVENDTQLSKGTPLVYLLGYKNKENKAVI